MSSQRSGFWGTVVETLRPKRDYDEYKALSVEEEAEEKIRLPTTSSAAEDVDASLLDADVRVRRQKKARSCMRSGGKSSLYWKLFAGVLAFLSLVGVFNLVRWAVTLSGEDSTTPTLEGMPVFGKDLGCDHASAFFQDAPKGYTLKAPIIEGAHHIKLMGSGVGTLIITSGASDATDVTYSVVMKGTDKALLDLAKVEVSETSFGSTLAFNTPSISAADLTEGSKCIRFDLIMSVPPSLNELGIRGYSTMQVKFDKKAHLDLKRLDIILFGSKDAHNMILPTAQFHADSLTLEVYKGWIVGEAAIARETLVDTQRDNGVAHVKFYPTDPKDGVVKAAFLRTATGSGRSDFWYNTNKNSAKRPINSHHISARNGDVHLKYENADFNGKIAMSSRTSTIEGEVVDLKAATSTRVKRDDEGTEWTHTRGDVNGADKLFVESNGWTGLSF